MGVRTLKRRAVFLDRDGVLNGTTVEDGAPRPPADVGHVVILPGVVEALELLGRLGFLRVVVTNQPDVVRGRQTREMVERINRHLMASLPLDAVYTCFHDDADGCDCRKPAPGLLRMAARAHDIDLARSYLVGDRWKDVAAGRAAGCETFLIGLRYSQRERCPPHHDVSDLLAAARRIGSLVRRSEEGA